MTHLRWGELKIRRPCKQLQRVFCVIQSETLFSARLTRRWQVPQSARGLGERVWISLQLTLKASQQLLEIRDGLLCIAGPRLINLGPLDGLLDLVDCLLQPLTFTVQTQSARTQSSASPRRTYFLTPFCRPRW